MSDFPPDELAPRRWFKKSITSDSDVRYAYGRPELQLLQLKKLHPSRGRALSMIGTACGLRRRWFERIPLIGDRWFRRRVTMHIRAQLPGFTEVRISAGYDPV